jgi:hypothetical protein
METDETRVSSYTKGEWRVTNTAFARWDTYRGKRLGARTFVTVGIEVDQVAEVHGDTDEECEANAHLIAAAPQLYETLKRTLDSYVSLVNSGDCGFWNPENEEQVKVARQALSKAERRE